MSDKPGALVISIDFEYAIGYADEMLSTERQQLVRAEAAISRRLIELFDRYQVPATWAVVGHLLETDCQVADGRVHADFPTAVYTDDDLDWFATHPPAGDTTDTLWFDSAGVIKAVKASSTAHELASHSYAHIIYGAPHIKPEAIQADLAGIKRIHEEQGLPLTSFIFPRNQEGFHHELQQLGVRCFRGQSRFWYMRLPGPLGRLARLFDYYLPSVRTVTPSRHDSGLINIPDSLLLLGRNGLRTLVTPGVMKRKLRCGLAAAANRSEIFHLWFHPSNFSYDTETQLAIFEDALMFAATLRQAGRLQIATMETIYKQL
jgi:hypothetical protein